MAENRRRGAELEAAILEAAWELLTESGVPGLSMDAVARRAKTSKHVLYRRWQSNEELLRAAVRHYGENREEFVPDTGTLRGDLLAMLQDANDNGTMAGLISVFAHSAFVTGNIAPEELRRELLGDRLTRTEKIFARAAERGEVVLDRVSPRVLRVPFDLFRNDYMLALRKLPEEDLVAIVDEVTIPLLRGAGAFRNRGGDAR
ncbi:MAG TPA: TetR/AcrR family transcriptional regulator [Candidatus Corynebacterium avicola]|uniref:TetR/AcrR family transcriptional regulator n=1 Tax=Candidatus Corynebacterium avicola TaxID=2838527 RepID=A0A9D1UKU1_9CORY|nr:TetR/AcrR family transcriptional regulator [Candidatus Corynebacterium avicola]